MTPAQREVAYLVTILTFVVGGLLYWRHHERADAIVQFQTKAADSTAKVERDSVASTSRTAQEAASQAQAQKAQALRLVAACEALRAKQDSLVTVSANARADAEKALADSQATVATLRGDLSRLVSATRADSAAHARTLASRDSLDRQLWRTISADSLALTAEQRRSQSLQALTETLTREVGLLKKAQPSTFGNVVRVVGWAGAGFVLGRAIK